MPAGIGETLFAAMKQVGSAVMKATGAEGLNVVQNNYSPGQQVPHVHWHLIPRFADDGYTAWPQGAYQDMQEMAALLTPSGKTITDDFKDEQKRVIFSRCRRAIFLNYR